MDTISNLIHRLSQDPFNYLLNFDVAQKYLELNQTASAVSFYLRCAEYGESVVGAKRYVYSSLLAIAKCFDTQKGRELSVSNTLLQAIAFDDSRPEAYFMLSNYYERAQQWQECYTFACLGLGWSYEQKEQLVDIGYDGEYCLRFEKAVSAYWIGRKQESLELFTELATQPILPHYASAVEDNLKKLGAL
jgi:hypothetical protein